MARQKPNIIILKIQKGQIVDINLQNKHAIVCGSTRGIGRAVAEELAQLGARVTLIARNEEALINVGKALSIDHGQSHTYICADFARPDELKSKIAEFLKVHAPAHILVNNTGGPPGGEAIEAEPEAFLNAFSRHLVCNQILTQAVIPGMKAEKYGRIINIISTSVKQPIKGLGVSNTIRGAVASWAKTLSGELGPHGITVNNVLPGYTRTGRLQSLNEAKAQKTGKTIAEIEQEMISQIPARRFAEPQEIAMAAAFLASPAAAYINGVSLAVDGGRTGCL